MVGVCQKGNGTNSLANYVCVEFYGGIIVQRVQNVKRIVLDMEILIDVNSIEVENGLANIKHIAEIVRDAHKRGTVEYKITPSAQTAEGVILYCGCSEAAEGLNYASTIWWRRNLILYGR